MRALGRARDRVDELFGRARRIRQAEMGQREVGVFRDRLLVEPPAVCRAKPLRQVAALEIQVSGFRRRRRDGDLVGGCRLGGEC